MSMYFNPNSWHPSANFESWVMRFMTEKNAIRLGKLAMYGGLVMGAFTALPHEGPSVEHNVKVEACADKLSYGEQKVHVDDLPKACQEFAYGFEGSYHSDVITLPDAFEFRQDNLWGPEEDRAAHRQEWLTVGITTVGGAALYGGFAFRRRLAEVDAVLEAEAIASSAVEQ